ncbi:conserved hypothetical protein [Candidatus Sulfopaludibacter sp. SbA3]|nr:conserved hypothetical protein [Candidatus Sulfopaludibacter sp. SbA3]
MAERIGFNGGPGSKDPGRITYTGVSLKMLLVRAYKIRPFQLVGPGWLESARFDLTAKVPPNTKDDECRLMLQKLLTDRFRIELHRETKELLQYRLTVAKGGHKLPPAEETPEYKDVAERMAAMQKQNAARMAAMSRAGSTGPQNSTHMSSATVATFAETLSSYLECPVKDMTGVDGLHAFTLVWAPDNAPATVDGPSGPSMAVALQEQLGLKLETAKGPVELLVIDKAEKSPIEN